jgi:hypothetical protein
MQVQAMPSSARAKEVDAATVAMMLNRTKPRVHQLVSDGVFKHLRRDTDGRLFFDVAEVADLVKRYRENPPRSGPKGPTGPRKRRGARSKK